MVRKLFKLSLLVQKYVEDILFSVKEIVIVCLLYNSYQHCEVLLLAALLL